MTERTALRNIAWLVVWDGSQHVYLHDSDLDFEGCEIVFIGKDYADRAERELNGEDLLVIPGLVDIHSHLSSEAIRKGITDETLSPGFWHSSLYEHLPVFDPLDDAGRMACLNVSISELLLSGVTTVADLSPPFEGWLEVLAESGMRAVIAPLFRDARWHTRNGHSLEYDWDEAAGRKAFRRAQSIIEQTISHPCGRISAMVSPSQVDTCGEELLRDSHAFAKERNLPWTIHAAQSVTEFLEMQRRHGTTPIQWLDDLGVLDERSTIAHCIFLDHHPWLHWTSQRDLGLLAEIEATIAHCPTVFSRRGIALNTFGTYLDHGVRLAVGTDTYPHNMLDEIRTAAIVARIAGQNVEDVTYLELFNAATIGGANALGRDDIGRLAVGCKADFACIDLNHPAMRPLREPLRNLLVVAADRAVRDVYVDGEQVVRDGTVQSVDHASALEHLQVAQEQMLGHVSERDWAGRTADALAPMMLETVNSLD